MSDWVCKNYGCNSFNEEYEYPPNTGKACVMWKLRCCNHCQKIDTIEVPY